MSMSSTTAVAGRGRHATPRHTGLPTVLHWGACLGLVSPVPLDSVEADGLSRPPPWIDLGLVLALFLPRQRTLAWRGA
jgi:hypothetical protein